MITQFSIFALDALLASTLVYLIVLMRRLRAFRQQENNMRKVVDDLVSSTDQAREAMAKLKLSILETQSTVQDQIGSARHIIQDLDKKLAESRFIMANLEQQNLVHARQLSIHASKPANAEMSLHPRSKINLDEISDLTKSLRMKVSAHP